MYSIRRLFNPEIFQGKYKRNNYFEGWYYKIIDKSFDNIWAIIPGIAISNEKAHSFIQVNEAKNVQTRFLTFPRQAFTFSEKDFDINIEDNNFNKFGFDINLTSTNYTLEGRVEFTENLTFPRSLTSPGIMGPYSFVPFMECHHGIINIHSKLKGGLKFNNRYIDFSDGYGYLEKDWGSSFPHSWIWMQSNNFSDEGVSLMFSIAAIPWLHREFDGLIAFLKVGNSFYRFATYTGAKIKQLTKNKENINIVVEDAKYFLSMEVWESEGGTLKAPKKGLMEVNINESITSRVKVKLTEKSGKLIFQDIGLNTGLELAGNYSRFLTDKMEL